MEDGVAEDPAAAVGGAAAVPSGSIGFIKNAQLCADTTKTGKPCRAPAAGGSKWCINHRMANEPDWVPPIPKRKARELAIQARVAQLREQREWQEKQDRKRKPKDAVGMLDAIRAQIELAPEHVAQVVMEGLSATTTKRVRLLNDNGTEAHAVNDKGDMAAVYTEIEIIDHDTRLAYLREVGDRLYGKPAPRREGAPGTGEVTFNIGAVLAQVTPFQSIESPEDRQAYYEQIPGEPVDVEPVAVLPSAPNPAVTSDADAHASTHQSEGGR